MKIKYKLVLIVIALGLFMIALAGMTYYLLGKQVMEDRITDQLHSVAILKSNALDRLIAGAATELEIMLDDGFIQRVHAHDIQDHPENDTEIIAVHEAFRKHLKNTAELSKNFDSFMIIDPEGKIHLSTDPLQEGKFRSDEPYFINGKKDTFIQTFYYDISLQRSAIAASTPIKDHHGNFSGVLVGLVNLKRIDSLMLERSGLGNTGETYLVNRYKYMLTDSRFEPGSAMKKKIQTPSVEYCLEGGVGEYHYPDYRGVPVIGYYRWIPEHDVCMLAEIDQEEAFQPINSLLLRVISISFIVFIVFVILTILLTRTITLPITRLREAAIKIDSGNLDVPIQFKSNDEIGELADSFRQMTANLKTSEYELHLYNKKLEKQVKERTKQLDKQVVELKDNKAALMNMMEDFEEALETQKRLERIKTEFLSVTSHELRTPITPMRAQLQMVLGGYMGKLTAEQKKSLQLVLNNTTRLDHLIGDILDISKLQSGVMKFVIENSDLNEIVKGAVETMKMKANDRGINVDFKTQPLPTLKFDKDRITQVVVNLINNAIKFTDAQGTITIEVINQRTKAVVKVTDTGIGIPKDDAERIFRPFEQVDSSRSRNYEGTGLGLAICQGIIIQHGGKIWVESEAGKGASFIFTIPFKPSVNIGEADLELFHFDKKLTVKNFRAVANKEGYMINEEFLDEMLKKGLINDKGKLAHGVSLSQLEAEGYITKIGDAQVDKQTGKVTSKHFKKKVDKDNKKMKKGKKGGRKNGKNNVRR